MHSCSCSHNTTFQSTNNSTTFLLPSLVNWAWPARGQSVCYKSQVLLATNSPSHNSSVSNLATGQWKAFYLEHIKQIGVFEKASTAALPKVDTSVALDVRTACFQPHKDLRTYVCPRMTEDLSNVMAAVCDYPFFSNSQNFPESKPWVCMFV